MDANLTNSNIKRNIYITVENHSSFPFELTLSHLSPNSIWIKSPLSSISPLQTIQCISECKDNNDFQGTIIYKILYKDFSNMFRCCWFLSISGKKNFLEDKKDGNGGLTIQIIRKNNSENSITWNIKTNINISPQKNLSNLENNEEKK